jgi:hypothetical protein
MIQSVRTGKLDPEMVSAVCEAAYDLASKASGGDTEAFMALNVYAERVPEKRFDCVMKRAALYDRANAANKSKADAEHLIEKLTAAADLGTSARRYVESAEAWRRALAVAQQINSPKLAVIQERVPAFLAREEASKRQDSLNAQLKDTPKDPEVCGKLLLLLALELDNPAEAVKFLDSANDEVLKTNLPLAAQPVEKLSQDVALTLAEWYAG